LRALVSELMSRPLETDRPLWCFHLIDNYRGGSALMGRIHHAIGDGIALVLVLLSLAETTPEWPHRNTGEDSTNPFSALFTGHPGAIAKVRRHAEELMPEGMKLLLNPVEALKAANPVLKGLASIGAAGRLTFRPPDPRTPFRGALGKAKRATWSDPLPVEEMREIAGRLGCNLNDVLLSSMAGGLGRYLESHGKRAEGLNFRAAVPVNLRPLERMGDLGNQFGLIFLSLPVGMRDPVARLAELRRHAAGCRLAADEIGIDGALLELALQPTRDLGVGMAVGEKSIVFERGRPGHRQLQENTKPWRTIACGIQTLTRCEWKSSPERMR
ncbi:MAG TPA: wax ester/triacylglycerol synthase family O-acyltransferase, partial [Thermoanaerobaculia bacterium]|nr:wax ester/triacylglycerol synthase family O-acyltransferase [Thermoanaerobaculia bacterium]